MRPKVSLSRTKTLDDLLGLLKSKTEFVFLYDNREDQGISKSYLFIEPVEIITCSDVSSLNNCFLRLESYLSQGYYAAGFLSYEAGIFFEDVLSRGIKLENNFPLFWFGIYREPLIFESSMIKEALKQERGEYAIRRGRFNTNLKDYSNDISKIKRYIRQGDTYQINYTIKYKFSLQGSIDSLFYELCRKQHVHYAAFIDTGSHKILSLSPELFFKRDKNKIILKPMKGTIDRGLNLSDDNAKSAELQGSFKNRAENIMIVDLIRNDIGRVSPGGSVNTKSIFDVEKYDTLFQMTSTVSARLKKGLAWYELFRSIFPSGSVTGAPKIRTMQIIGTLEKEPRNVYTGSIGFMSPDKTGTFNVAIRTILFDKKTGQAEMGIGSGIVWDSEAAKEYEECKLKAKFLTEKYTGFELFETMLWRYPGRFFILNYHLDRLEQSAAYFGFMFDKNNIIERLKEEAGSFDKSKEYRVRLVLHKDGNVKIEARVLSVSGGPKRIAFSNKKTNSGDCFLFHKTTKREFYEEEYARYKRKGFFDVIFANEKNEITEGAISNIFVKKNGIYYTPPISCGLLCGTFRSHLINAGKIPIKEKILHKDDIIKADRIYLTNALRGMVEVKLES